MVLRIPFEEHTINSVRSILRICLMAALIMGLSQVQAKSDARSDARSDVRSDAKSDAECQITAGVAEWRPYQYQDSQGQARGLQVELLMRIFNEAECRLNFVFQSAKQSHEQLISGEIDAMFSATHTPERETYAFFSEPYRKELLVLYVTQQYSQRCNEESVTDLVASGLQLGLQSRSFYNEEIEALMRHPSLSKNLHFYPVKGPLVSFVKENNLDGTIDDPIIVAYHLRETEDQQYLFACNGPVSTSPVAIMFSKKSVPKDLIPRFNQAIKRIKNTKYYRNVWSW